MMTLITGGSGSGKSAYAEKYISALSKEHTKYYLATMQVYDGEGQAKVERHRKLREGRGFITIEQPVSIHGAIEQMKGSKECLALLECMSNLVANEMFSGEVAMPCNRTADKIIRDVEQLERRLEHLVVVTNNVFEDGVVYDETTMEYIRAMGRVNEKLAQMADTVIEVVVGIPLIVKGEELLCRL